MRMKEIVACAVGFACAVCGAETPLRESALQVLPLGSVRPEGTLRARLVRQAEGLTGRAEELYRDIGQSDWLTNAGRGGEFGWERGPYYARGLVALALVLDDAKLKARAKRWVDAALASQRADGDFGPRPNNWWANMLPLAYLRDWAEATGDTRVVPFLERYFAYQEKVFGTQPLEGESCWACARGGDEVEVALWLHGKTGEPRWLAFARRLMAMTADWTGYYQVGGDPGGHGTYCGGYRCHIVNFMQGLKAPALKWLLGGNAQDRGAYAATFEPNGWVMQKCGRPDAMVNGSEPLTDRSAAGGTELCAIAERIVSCQSVLSTLGDASVADDLEDVAYNALAATVTPDMKGMRYYLLLNQPTCEDKNLLFANNGADTGAICPGPHAGFGCCRSNWHVAWPKFVQTMWMRNADGLALVAHGPTTVSAQLPCGAVTLRAETDYPRSGKVTVRVISGGGRFPLFVRVPRWAELPDAGTFRRYDREWKVGETVELDFPMSIRLTHWANNAVSVRRGPLLYALMIEESWKKIVKHKIPYEKAWSNNADFPKWEIRPKTPWNYALVLKNGQLADAEVRADGREIRARAVRTEAAGWGYLRADAPGRAVDPPRSPVARASCTDEEWVTLVPLADRQLRLALLPWVE